MPSTIDKLCHQSAITISTINSSSCSAIHLWHGVHCVIIPAFNNKDICSYFTPGVKWKLSENHCDKQTKTDANWDIAKLR